MYCNHYGFSERPFSVTPDPRFLYLTPIYQETLSSIIYGITERRGFITIMGEVGTGKTTLLNAAMDRLDDSTKVAFIFNTDVPFTKILNMALYEWGLLEANERLSKVDAVHRLNAFAIDQLSEGGNVALIVDEAQNLSNSVMENLRMLSNLETRRHKLVQIVLSGQPELDAKLEQYELRQFAQRISLRRYISPFNEKETYAYLRHRLKLTEYPGTKLFTTKAQKLIWDYSAGIARKINILCDNALLIGYGLGIKKIKADVIKEAALDLKWRHPAEAVTFPTVPPFTTPAPGTPRKPPQRRYTLAAIVAAVFIFLIAGSTFLSNQKTPLTTIVRVNEKTQRASQSAKKSVRTDIQIPKTQPADALQEVVADALEHPETAMSSLGQGEMDQGIDDHDLTREMLVAATKNNPPIVDQQETQQFQFTSEDKGVEKNPETETAAEKSREIKMIRVRKGETLSSIIIRTRGSYDEKILTDVLQENPNLNNPNQIRIGQLIKIPMKMNSNTSKTEIPISDSP